MKLEIGARMQTETIQVLFSRPDGKPDHLDPITITVSGWSIYVDEIKRLILRTLPRASRSEGT